MFRNWLRRKPPAPARRVAPHAEWLEPRLLYSADAGALLSTVADPHMVQTRMLATDFEYAADSAATPSTEQVRAAYALTPLQFEANQGQLGEGVDFAASGVGYAVRLGGGQAELLLDGADDAVRLELVGAGSGTAEGQDLLATRSNSLVGQDASKWATDIANYGSVVYRGVYAGIDVRYYGNQDQLEYDFVVAAGADASQLQVRFHGTDAVRIDANGDLVLQVAGTDREVRFQAPVSWQEGANGREAVESHYALQADGSVRIVVGAYDTSRALVVDPVLAHASYFGETGGETALAVAVGPDGSVYVTGQTRSNTGAFASRLDTASDPTEIYVARFNADLTSLLYATRVGGGGTEEGTSIAVDASGNAVVTGWTRSNDFVGAASGDQGSRSGAQDAVLFKLNAAGNAVVFSTYFGSDGATDVGRAVALDASGNIFIAGTISPNAIILDPILGPLLGGSDNAFLNKYTAGGTALGRVQFGGGGVDDATALALDAAGNIYMVGNTTSNDLDIVRGAQATRPGAADAFLVRFDGSGVVRYSTYIGDSDLDTATGVAVDGSGRAYVIGQTDDPSGSGFTTTVGALSRTAVTHTTGYLRIYDTTKTGATSLQYSTFIGGTLNGSGNPAGSLVDNPTGVAVAGGRVAIVGTSRTSNLPTTADAVSRTNTSGDTGFVLLLNPQGTGSGDLLYGSYYGTGLALNGVAWSGNNVYVVGSTSTGGLATSDGYHTAPGGADDGLVAVFAGLGNAAPVLSGAVDLPAQLEDAASAGTLVADLLTNKVTDADAGALAGIAVTAVDSSKGTWQYTVDGTTWKTLATPATGSALLLAADGQTRVRLVPNANANGSSSITFRAWDRSAATAGTVVPVAVTGGISAFSSATATANVTVTPVNDAPVRTAGSGTITANEGGPTSLVALSGFAWSAGGGSDEAAQALTYTITGLPTGVATITLGDGTPLAVGTSYSLAQLQDLRYQLLPGSGTLSFTVSDNGGTANGGVATLAESITINVTNVAPSLTGANDLAGFAEDVVDNGTAVTDLIAGKASDPAGRLGIAVTGVVATNGNWQYSLDGGTSWSSLNGASAGSAILLAADGQTRVRFVPAADWNGTVANGLKFRAWDRSAGTAGGTADTTSNGGSTAFSATEAASSITVSAVNDPPVRTAGTLVDLAVDEGTPATSLGLGTLAYGRGGGSDEAVQTLAYTVTAVPSSLGKIVLADGTTLVSAGTSYTLAQIQGMKFVAGVGVSGSGTFSFSVKDSGGTLAGGRDTLAQSLTVQVANRAPVLNGASAMNAVYEDFDASGGVPQGNPPAWTPAAQRAGMLVGDLVAGHVTDATGALVGIAVTGTTGSGAWQYTLNGGSTWLAVGASATGALLLPADSQARLRFVPAADWNGTATITFRAWDRTSGSAGGTADTTVNGGTSAFSLDPATASVAVLPVNDAPVLAAGTLAPVSVPQGSSGVSLGFAGLTYAAGGGADEATQTLAFRATTLPAASFGSIRLADGSAVVAGTAYTLAQWQGMQFRPAAGAALGTASFGFTVVDSGGTGNGGQDSLAQSLSLTLVNEAPVLTGANPLATVQEDAAAGNGMLVADMVAGTLTDPGLVYGIAVTSADVAHGTWQYSTDGGSSWSSLAGVSEGSARLLDTDARVRFVPAADWNGTASLGLVGWDRTSGTAGGLADVTTRGGTTAFSTATATSTITVGAVNDAPVRTGGGVANLTVAEDSGSTSLGLAGLAYGPGGGLDETAQGLTYTITALPPASLGRIVLADGTVVTAGSYALADLQGMRFVAAADAHGSGSFGFVVQDSGGGSNDALAQGLTITVTPANDAPVAQAGTGTLAEGGTITGTVAIGDADLPGDTLTVTLVTGPAHGTLVLAADGSYTYTHDGSETFADGFTYRVTDADGESSEAAVTFTVTPVNDNVPLAQAGAATVAEGGTVAGTVVASDGDAGNDTLTFSVVTDPVHGTLSIAADGSYSYVHDGSENFSDAFTYAVTDAAGHTSQATVTLTITPVNDNTPVAQGGAITLAEGATVTGTVSASDTDAGNDALTFSVATDPAHGTLTLAADGSYSYVHDGSEAFSDAFTYEVTDAAGHTSQATVTLTITPVNDNTPVAQSGTATVNEGGTVTGTVIASDTDAGNDTLSFGVATDPAHGTLTFAADGSYSYVHDGSENFSDAFTYEVTDASGHTSQGTVTLTITPVNDNTPVAQGAAVTLAEGATLTGTVIASDTDAGNDTLTFSVATDPVHGTLTFAADGSYSYVHDGSENFGDAFTYEVTDAAGHTSQGTVTLTITPVNDNTPVPQSGSATLDEGGTVTGTVIASDTDGSNDTLTFSVATDPAHGSLTFAADGSFSYVHDGSENFSDAFTYEVTDAAGHTSQATVTLTITPVNDNTPVAQGAAVMLAEGGTVTGTVIASDTDAGNDTLTFSVATNPVHGTLTVTADGSYSYVHDGSENFSDAFTYEVKDAAGHTSQATVTLTITPVNDNTPVAQSAAATVNEGGTVTGTVIASDTDGSNDTLAFSVVTDPMHGTLTLAADGSYSYVHDGSENFGDAFTYEVTDAAGHTSQATVTLTITPVNDSTPVARSGAATLDEGGTVTGMVVASDTDAVNDTLTFSIATDPAHGTLTFAADGSYSYVHDGSENFSDAFTYEVTDAAGHTSQATVTLTITPVNDNTPVAQSGSATLDEGGTVTGSVVASDTDAANDTLTFSVATDPVHGTLTFAADGSYSYVHDGSENFSDAFTYEVTDAAGHTSQATVTLTITPVNDNTPAAQSAAATVNEGGTVTGTVIASDTDGSNDTLTFSVATAPAHGTLTFAADGSFSYVHDGSENFSDAFAYEVTDAAGHTSRGTVTLTVTPVNDNTPAAQAGAATVNEGGTVTGTVIASDTDGSNDTLTFSVATDPAHGTLTFAVDGSYSYVHDGSENFSDAFAYEVTDAAGHTSRGTVTLTVTPVNDNTPAAQAGAATVNEGGTVTGTVIASDTDAVNDTLTFSVATDPVHGTLTFAADGSYSYVHNSSESFSDAFIYQVTDAAGHTSQGTVTLTITPVNDNTPVAQSGSATVDEGGTVTGTVVASDADAGNDTLTFSVASDPAHGTLTFAADGSYSYVHDGSENFSDAFSYEVTDAAGHTSHATVTLTITPVNDNTPVAQGAAVMLAEGGTVTDTVGASDADAGNDTLTFSVASDPVHGTLTFAADGSYSYVHDGSENFSDVFTYEVTDAAGHTSHATVTLTITPVNDNTPAAQSSAATVNEGGTVTGTVGASDTDAGNDTLTFRVVTDPVHGTLTFAADGSYSYVHDGSENFSDAFTYEVTDAAGHTSQVTVTLTITPVNDHTPVAQGAAVTLAEGATVTGTITASDTDAGNDTLTFSVATNPVHGTLTFAADGSYSYVHDGSENFSDAFTYEVTDAAGHTSQATVTLTITPVNDNTPVALPGAATVNEGGTVTGTVIASDTDGSNDTLTFSVATDPVHGTLTFAADGSYSYVHDGSENFSDAFTYEVTDAAGHVSQATVTLTITPVNDNTPVAQSGSAIVDEGGTVTSAVVASDTDAGNDTLRFSVVTDPMHGTLTLAADGSYSYVHDGSENFSDAFTYEVTDGAGHTSQATVTLTITPVNDNTPVAQSGTAAVNEGGTVTGTVVASDADAGNDTLTFSVVTDPMHGTLTFAADGSYSYVHDGSENFGDAFTYEVTDAAGHASQATVTVTITPANDNTPVAQSGTATVNEGGTVTGTVIASDTDGSHDTLTFSVAIDPVHGTLTFAADGSYSYVHDGSENFSDAFTYEVTDAAGNTSQANVTLTITPVNDNTPAALSGAATVNEGGTVTGTVIASDTDAGNDTLTFSVATDPVHGTLTFAADGSYSYVHDGSESFSDAFIYQVTDAAGHTSQATVTLTITPVNDNTPVTHSGSATLDEGGTVTGAVVAGDTDAGNDTLTFSVVTDPAHGTLTFAADGSYSYVHDGSENFSDAFTYEVTDAAGHTSQATVTLTITPVNDNTPVPQSGSATLDEGGTVTGTVVAGDTDAANDTLTFSVATDPVHGTLTFAANGSYSYVHDGSENFSDVFTYKVTDAAGHTSQATVTLTITPVNDNTPVAQSGSATLDEGGTVTGTVVASDTDAANDTLTFSVATDPVHGALTFATDGSYSYVHDGSENFSDAFIYKVTDAAGHTSQATVTLTITPVNDNTPVAQSGSATLDEGGTVTGTVVASDTDAANETLTFNVATDPLHGTLTFAADGSYSYVHDGSENFSDAFIYEVTDAAGHSSQGTITLTITPVNDNAPTAQGAAVMLAEGGTATGSLIASDTDAGNDTLTFSVATHPVHGTLTFATDGSYSYVHDGSENFSDSFTYEVTDAAGHTSQATVTLTITPVNDNTPAAQSSAATVNEGSTVTGTVVASDTDAGNDTLTFIVVTDPVHGTLTFAADGSYSYVHEGSENFSDAFTYEVTDAAGHTSQATVTLTITPVNDNTPAAQSSAATVNEGSTVTGTVVASDTDAGNDTLTFSVATNPVHGTLTFAADGSYSYVHDGSENFSDAFTYEVTDAAGHTSQGTVTLTITPVNDNMPAAQAGAGTVNEGGAVTGTVIASDTDAGNDTLTFSVATDPLHGTLTLASDGSYSYVHDGSENFSDAFTYEVTDAAGHTSQATVTLTITPVNDSTPVAQSDAATLDEGGTVTGRVVASDTDAGNDTLTFSVASDPVHGTLTFAADGSYSYVHDGSENFSDAFTYEVTDAAGHTSQATVTLTITPVNDNTPAAQPGGAMVSEGGTVTGTVIASDTDGSNDTLAFSVVTDPVHGTLTLAADGSYSYVHDGGENFSDAFTYEVTDAAGHTSQATVTLTITPVNDNTPVAQSGSATLDEGGTVTGTVVASDTDAANDTLTFSVAINPAHGTLTFAADGSYSYVHDGSENFSDAFTYEVTDAAGHTRQGTVTLTITPVNDNTPVAQGVAVTLAEGATATGTVLANDTDAGNDTLTFSVATDPAHGTLTFAADGSYSYVHDGSENFSDAFSYEVTDAAGHTSQGSVTLTITPVNDNTPAAQDAAVTLAEGATVAGTVGASDVDAGNDTLTFSVASDPVHGTLTLAADGSYSYVHDGSENFSDAFTYEVTDAAGHTSQATVTLTITPVNDNTPVAQSDSATLDEGGTVTGTVIASDTDGSNDTLTFSVATNPAHGTLTFAADGSYSYVHDGSENFSDAFTYEVTDAAGHTSQATVTLTITPVNDNTPVAQGGAVTVAEGGTVTGTLGAGDADADAGNDAMTFSVVTDPVHGTLTSAADGSYSYVHDGSENFSDAFTYEVTDAAGHTSRGTVTLTVTPVNDNTPAAQSGAATVNEGGTVTGTVSASDGDASHDTLTFGVVGEPVHGTLTLAADGNYSYVHDGSENFSDAFTYEVTDAAGHTSQATVTLTITPVNDNTPVAQGGALTVAEGGTVTGTLGASDADADAGNDALTFSVATDPVHGTLTFAADGSYSYVHDGSENFSDAFSYEVKDAAGHTSRGTVTLTITPVNDNTPVAQGAAVTLAEGATVTGTVIASDTDGGNDTLTFSVASAPVHGTLTLAADGSYSYVHDGSENFSDAFTFMVTDAAGHTSQAALTLTITPVNDNTPVAQGAAVTLVEGATVTGTVIASDTDGSSDALTFSVATDPAHGTLTFAADGSYSYVHDGSENFSDAFSYAVTDADGQISQATVTLTITPVNDNTPVAQSGAATLDEGGTVTGTVVAVDTDAGNDTLAFSVVTDPVHGTLTLAADGSYSYVHDGSENFSDAFTYEVTDAAGHTSRATVTLTITPVNDNMPVAQSGSATVDEGGTVTGTVVASDADAANDTLTFSVASSPVYGTLTINSNGSYSYVHDGSENFSDAFTYEVTDAAGHTSQATVVLTVTPVNDNTPVAQGGAIILAEGATVTGTAAASDIDAGNDALTFSVATDPVHGTLAFAADGSFSYVHDGSENFSDAFTYEVTDAAGHTSQATMILTITPVNDNAPVTQSGSATVDEGGTVTGTVFASDSDGSNDILTFSVATDPAHGRLTLAADGSYRYVHDGSENFSDVFTYEVTDAAGHTSQATVTLTITPVNDNAPVAQSGRATVDEGGTVTGTVFASDTDAANDTLTFSVTTPPAHGTLTFAPDGSYTYTHDGTENLTDAFTYEVTDAAGHTSRAAVTLAITPVNDNAPRAQAGASTVAEGGSIAGSVSAIDVDAPHDALTFALVNGPAHGTVTFHANGSYTYAHDGSDTVADAFSFRVTDAAGASSVATVAISVAPVDDPSTLRPDFASVPEDTAATGNVLANDADSDSTLGVAAFQLAGDRTVYAAGQTAQVAGVGAFTLRADGSWLFSPARDFDGAAPQVAYTTVTHATSTLDITVTAVDDAPVLTQDAASGVEDGAAVTGNVLANDSDVDSPLQVATFRIGGNDYAAGSTARIAGVGSFTLAADGSYSYTASPDWSGTVPTVRYTVASGESSTLTLTIAGSNDAPVRSSPAPADVTVVEGSGATPLGFSGLAYGPGGGSDEAAQGLTVAITALPTGIGRIVLADGRTEVAAGGVYTLADLRGMQFVADAGTSSGSASFAFTVMDDQGATLSERIAIAIVNQAPTLAGANALPTIAEDTVASAGMLVTDLLAGQASDPSGHYGIAVVAAQSDAGTWQFTRDGGASWQAFAGVRSEDAELLAADAGTRIRFVPNADWNGDASGLVLRAWDRSDDAVQKRADTTVNGGSSAFSSEVAVASVHVAAVNDAPRATGGTGYGLAAIAGTPSDPLMDGSTQYSPGGGSDEAAQALTVTVTGMPPAAAGTLVLADGTTVAAGTRYSLDDFRGVRFVPAADSAGSVVEVQWILHDDGGTQSGGSDATPGSVRIQVAAAAPVPDAPAPETVPENAPAPAPAPVAVAPAPAPITPVPVVPAANAPAPVRTTDSKPLPSADQARGDAPVAAALLPAASGFARSLQFTQDPGHLNLVALDLRDLQPASFNPASGEFAVVGFAGTDLAANRITLDQFQQTLRSGAFVEELNRLRKQLHDEFDIDRTVSITVAGLSLGASVLYVLWLIRGGVLLGSYLSALPAWRLLDPLPVLARAGDEEDEDDDEAFAPADGRAPDPLRGFA